MSLLEIYSYTQELQTLCREALDTAYRNYNPTIPEPEAASASSDDDTDEPMAWASARLKATVPQLVADAKTELTNYLVAQTVLYA